jgi:uncharacterized protein YbaR (Trm112 family)
MALDGWVLEMLRCPVSGETLSPTTVDGAEFLVTPSGIRYPVLDGVPVLLADQAIQPGVNP